jgi:germination protein M
MSRRRRRPSRAPKVFALLLLLAFLGGAGYVWRTRPDLLTRLLPKRPAPAPATYQPTTVHPVDQSPASVTARLYFRRLTEQGERLVAVARSLPGESPARAALQELVSGELPQGCERPLPEGTKLLGVSVKAGLATADFSPELVRNFSGGSDNESVVIYAIVNTLNSLPSVERTRLTVAGKPLGTLGGHVEIEGPLESDEELVVAR